MKNILTKIIVPIAMVLSGLSSYSYADCPDIIEWPKHEDISVAYRTQDYYKGDWKKAYTNAGCRKNGVRHWTIHHRTGKSCAKSQADGCSMKKWGIDFANAFSVRDRKLMTPSCNQHDICYHTKGVSKNTCDNEFKNNLLDTYKKWHGAYSTETVYQAVRKFGEGSYKDGQTWASNHQCK